MKFHEVTDEELAAASPEYAEHRQHRFIVIVTGCTKEQAKQVLAERLDHDEDYGFDYSVQWGDRRVGGGEV